MLHACEAHGVSLGSAHKMTPPFTVNATKKGELPISLDKRKWGKLVTRVDNVGGDADSLAGALKGALGTGGHSLPGAVEVQGDQREAISAWLIESGCVKGLRRNKAEQVTVVDAVSYTHLTLPTILLV